MGCLGFPGNFVLDPSSAEWLHDSRCLRLASWGQNTTTQIPEVQGLGLGMSLKESNVHPGRLTWNIIMEIWKIIFLSKWVICRFYVNLPGCSNSPGVLLSVPGSEILAELERLATRDVETGHF